MISRLFSDDEGHPPPQKKECQKSNIGGKKIVCNSLYPPKFAHNSRLKCVQYRFGQLWWGTRVSWSLKCKQPSINFTIFDDCFDKVLILQLPPDAILLSGCIFLLMVNNNSPPKQHLMYDGGTTKRISINYCFCDCFRYSLARTYRKKCDISNFFSWIIKLKPIYSILVLYESLSLITYCKYSLCGRSRIFLKVVYNVRTNTIIIFCRSNHHHPGPDSGLDFAADARSVQTNIFHHCTVICFINQKVFLARMCLLPLI